MIIFQDICYMLAGLGVFLLGMKLMSDGLQKSAGKGLRVLFDRLNNKKIVSYAIGAGTTAVIQSSSATSVMTLGLVNAGLMSLPVGLAVCLGAKVGTTITGILASLASLPISAIFCFTALIGVGLILFVKKNGLIVQIGYVITGFGTLFAGMYLMKMAISDNEMIMTTIRNIFSAINIPALLIIIGVVVTAIVQSSSSVSVILVTLIGTGAIQLEAGIFILIGASIGTCATAMLASIGASKDSLRLAIMNLFCSILAACTLGTVIAIIESTVKIDGAGAISYVFSKLDAPEWSLSLFGLAYNFIAASAMLPFTDAFIKLSYVFVPNKEGEKNVLRLYYVDNRLLKTPGIAIAQVKKEILNMGKIAKDNLVRGLNALIDLNFDEKSEMAWDEDRIDFITKGVSSYLVQLACLDLAYTDEKFVGSQHHVIDDMERIGDHATNFMEQAEKMIKDGYHFSQGAITELNEMREKVLQMMEATFEVYNSGDENLLKDISARENEIDFLKKQFSNHHVERLNAGGCDVETGTFFYSAISALERIADHLVNVAFSIKSITGSQKEAYATMHEQMS